MLRNEDTSKASEGGKRHFNQEGAAAERAIREGVDKVRVIIGVNQDGSLKYASENELVKIAMTLPHRQTRGRPRF